MRGRNLGRSWSVSLIAALILLIPAARSFLALEPAARVAREARRD